MNIQQAKAIPITGLLSRLGHGESFTRKGYESWYLSPFRREKTESFKVNTRLNCWADFGIGGLYHKPGKIGGDIIDFAKEYKRTKSSGEALCFIRGLIGGQNQVEKKRGYQEVKSPPSKMTLDSIKIIMVKPLENRALLDYLASRKINLDIAKLYLQEIYYRVNGKDKNDIRQRLFFASCMQNDSKAYEVRNEFFKGVLGGKKNITTLQHTDDPYLSIFEGIMDFLSLLTLQKRKFLPGTTIILHSTNMVKQAIRFSKQYDCKKITTYLDNDDAGEWAYGQLENELPHYKLIRGNALYKGAKDLNEWWVNVGK